MLHTAASSFRIAAMTRRTPEKVLSGHPYDVELRRKSSGAHRASDLWMDIAKAVTSPHGANARPSRAGRWSDYCATGATSARTRSKTADPKGESIIVAGNIVDGFKRPCVMLPSLAGPQPNERIDEELAREGDALPDEQEGLVWSPTITALEFFTSSFFSRPRRSRRSLIIST